MQVLPPRLPQQLSAALRSEASARSRNPARADASAGPPVTVWDLPLRLFHWSLLALFVLAYATGSREQYYGLHKAAGIALFGLLIFRLIWGFIGNRAARFSSFLKRPRQALAHARELLSGRAEPVAGHNALGGYAVAVMLILLLIETVSGLFSSTFDYEGPLAPLLSDAWTDRMARVHALNLDLLLAMIALHLLAIAITSALGRENLVASMIHGRKRLHAPATGAPGERSWARAALAAAAAAASAGGTMLLGRFLA
jgi:cytochrome b